MIQFTIELEAALKSGQGFGRQGGPWEFNLRDIIRWLALLHDRSGFEEMRVIQLNSWMPSSFVVFGPGRTD